MKQLTFENTKNYPQHNNFLNNHHKAVYGVKKLSCEKYEEYLKTKGQYLGYCKSTTWYDGIVNKYVPTHKDFYLINGYYCYIEKYEPMIDLKPSCEYSGKGCSIKFEL